MGFDRRGGGGGGGKRGARQSHGSFKIHGVKLRPVPEQPLGDPGESRAAKQKRVSKGKGKAKGETGNDDDQPAGQDATDEEDESEFGYREGLVEEDKPLRNCKVSITGLQERKHSLLSSASDLGATVTSSMTEATTHLIADERGSDKFNVSCWYLLYGPLLD